MFNENTAAYTATTSNATNTVTATAADNAATVSIVNGDTTVQNGTAVTWADGENVLKITVTNGGKSKTYTVTVTKE